jgi:hypothetical protein
MKRYMLQVNQCLFIISLSCLRPSGVCLYIDICYCVISFTLYNGIPEEMKCLRFHKNLTRYVVIFVFIQSHNGFIVLRFMGQVKYICIDTDAITVQVPTLYFCSGNRWVDSYLYLRAGTGGSG